VRARLGLLRAIAAAGLVLAVGPANACGYCIEDREAAVYDHGVIANAQARHHTVVFFAIEGEIKLNSEPTRRALVAALEAGGGDKSTARVALPSASCSVAYDPAKVSLAQLEARANRALVQRGLTLAPLRMTTPSDGLVEAKP
jgi:hypothetical protein